MSGARNTRTVLARALTVACVALLCLFGPGPAMTSAATAAELRPASSVPSEPTEGPSDPGAEPEARAAVRPAARGVPAVQRPMPEMFHVKHADEPSRVARYGTAGTAPSRLTVTGVVLRC
ncbi:hypothetical protein OOK31_19890 [Streptomyces sp. NBC_00249]|uniref:hypothetical protein n=1 Tax=Streptomyces sp. NBC_00249 TaxID=2975690 RepID=UPI002258F7F6|nr:hypothetical protein [Streptomyces sp. NBC_00249]MCX5196130.1 hypothetical protein [Streptomyces sp. NBC_00249]